MKKIFFLIVYILINTFTSFSQENYRFGELSKKELEMQYYEKDSTASAVVLYEEANTDFFVYNDSWIYIRTKVYRKVKIFNKDGFDQANITINAQKGTKRKELIKNVKGITHNNGRSSYLSKDKIFTTSKSEYRDEITFTLPNIKDGSVIEYTYTKESPFLFNFSGWTFQNDIPTIESVFIAEIPGNYIYNRKLIGYYPLVKNESRVKKRCFNIDGIAGFSDCEVLTYSMKDVPAFIEEDYMTSKWNYLSRIDFELSEFKGFDGHNKKYTKTWKAVDRDYKSDRDIGGQLNKKNFFKKEIPESVLNEKDLFIKAQKVYYSIQKHYTWNEKYNLFGEMNVTKAFKSKIGNVGEINISLINALKAAGINAQMGLLSTRNNGYPTKLYPVISDFNYIIARVVINEKVYYLDATQKSLPFGMLPYKCLNKDLRVMDFKNGSYWENILPNKNNGRKTQMLLKLNEDDEFVGNVRIVHNGYSAIEKRRKLKTIEQNKYVEDYEDENDFLEIVTYKNFNVNKNEETVKEEFEVIIENESSITNKILLNPFFIDKLTENPFKLNSRQYPVNFGHPLKFDFTTSITLPSNYIIETLPKSRVVKLPEEKGYFMYKVVNKNSKIMVNYSFNIKEVEFTSQYYLYLKEFYKQAIIAQSESIVLTKN